jgi:sporulation protein YlmC with PRC-barrel domain
MAGLAPVFSAEPIAQTGHDTNVLRGYYNTDAPKAGVDVRTSTPQRDRAASSARFNTGDTASIEKITRGSDFIGMKVKNSAGETLGDVKDLALDVNSGRILYAVLSSGGFLGFRDKEFAVPLSAFTRSTEDKVLLLNANKELLTSTPGLIKNHWPDAPDQSFVTGLSAGRTDLREPAGAQIKVQTKTNIFDNRDRKLEVDVNRK